MLVAVPGARPTAPLLVGASLIYALGKVAEVSDGRMFALGGMVSGHTIKHLLAAVAAVSSCAGWWPDPGNATRGGRS